MIQLEHDSEQSESDLTSMKEWVLCAYLTRKVSGPFAPAISNRTHRVPLLFLQTK